MIIMAIVAHPTDAFDMVGGTLANHIQRGDEVHVCFTHARMHDDAFRLADRICEGDSKADQAAIDAESEHHIRCAGEACKILGIQNLSTIAFKDEILTYTSELVGKVATRIQEIQPDILITHNPMETGGVTPHAVCGQLVLEGMSLARGARSNGLKPHCVAQLFFICNPGNTTWLDAMCVNRYPAIQIDVTAHVNKKVEALSKLDAQNYTPQMAAKLVEATGGMAAFHQCVTYAEHFQAFYPQVYQHLPVSDYNLKRSRELDRDATRRLHLIAPYADNVLKDRK